MVYRPTESVGPRWWLGLEWVVPPPVGAFPGRALVQGCYRRWRCRRGRGQRRPAEGLTVGVGDHQVTSRPTDGDAPGVVQAVMWTGTAAPGWLVRWVRRPPNAERDGHAKPAGSPRSRGPRKTSGRGNLHQPTVDRIALPRQAPPSRRTTPPGAPWSSKTLSARTYHHHRRGSDINSRSHRDRAPGIPGGRIQLPPHPRRDRRTAHDSPLPSGVISRSILAQSVSGGTRPTPMAAIRASP